MNKQRKVLITITYNEMGIIIDTKAEEIAQPNLQPTCNQLATDCISRQTAIDAVHKNYDTILDFKSDGRTVADSFEDIINTLPSAQSEREDYTEMKREFLRMASYIDSLLICSDEQKETLMNFISRIADDMPWTERRNDE